MSLIRMRALRRFRLKPNGEWIAKDTILHLAPRKARTMRKRGNVAPLEDGELGEMEPGWYPREAEPCSPCVKKKTEAES